MSENEPVAELIAMLDAAVPTSEGAIFDHTPEEIGLHVMENVWVILAALRIPAREEVSGERLAELIESELKSWRGVNGGVYAIHAASLALAKIISAAMNPKPAKAEGGVGEDATFLRDLAKRMCDVPAVHIDGGDIDEVLRIAASLATPATEKAVAYPGLPMSDADLAKHFEASKRDIVGLVGSEVRQIIGELRYWRSHPPAADVAAMREALKPFADCCDQIRDDEPDDEWAKFRLTVADYRRAKAALAALPEEPSA